MLKFVKAKMFLLTAKSLLGTDGVRVSMCACLHSLHPFSV